MNDQAVTTRDGVIVRNAAQGPETDPDDGPRVALAPIPEVQRMANVNIQHPDGRTASVSPKVAAFLAGEGFQVVTDAAPGDEPAAPDTEPIAQDDGDQGEPPQDDLVDIPDQADDPGVDEPPAEPAPKSRRKGS